MILNLSITLPDETNGVQASNCVVEAARLAWNLLRLQGVPEVDENHDLEVEDPLMDLQSAILFRSE